MRLLSPSLLLRASRGLATRACSRRDAQYLRRVSDGGFVLPAANPGVRLEPGFVDEAEEEALAAEARAAALSFGYDYDGDRRAHVLNPADGSIESTREVVNNTRVTGRPEKADQALPPWGYGDDFDESALPPAMGALAGRLRGSGLYNVGALRDLTLNLRRDSFFQLDPHLDPRLDGPHVFVLGLLSSVVTTFSPSDALLGANGLPPRRRDPSEVGLRSWSDLDIDAMCQPRTLLHFAGDARDSWLHAIRPGVEVDLADGAAVCDWWGQTDYLVRRSPSRISIVLAFAEG
uniref:Uncharacterized protein n=1 Tax=Emiliania huxleyi TaxID=2903 RepID=A0A6V2L871_EMIHU|mmetsp:Transcript_9359/g.30142  ORF Transcript_9359/g.30142 Transcript_9359/m.30142 type:complete len:290 (-) Transcript_9359:165-1034(-)